MAMVPTCDRCKIPDVQIVSVLGTDLCNWCIGDLRAFIAQPPLHRGVSARSSLVAHALRVCAAKGVVRDVEIAQVNQEPVRRAYYRLMGLARQGRVVHQGKGVFVLPQADAAE
jgi:hypothetical protein